MTQTICHILPRGMSYAREGATSIDLFVSEIAAHSRFRNVVVAEHAPTRLEAALVLDLPRYRFANGQRRALFVAREMRALGPALLVVQQHLPSAAAIAAQADQPAILQKHNFIKVPRPGLLGRLGKQLHIRQLNRLAGITLVSEAVRADFERHWPEVAIPRCVVTNGIETAQWQPAPEREQTVLVVGRSAPEKGTLEAAQALAAVLPRHPGWGATFIVSEPGRHPAYHAQVAAALAPLGARAQVLESRPFAEVKAASERAAIALIPSKWAEPFGRTCVEAHAGGAAVISSGSGGLREISGDAALFLPAVEAPAIAAALEALIADPALRARLAAAGAARVRALFDLSAVAARFDAFCAQAIERAATGK